ncbi:MAG: GtrA family protein [Burkholderiales bacterium]|nr:MAG: GtrA family protein [Burkholderiales bacterium]
MNYSAEPTGQHSTRQRLVFFLVVGAMAAAVHWLVVVGLVSQLGLKPLLANIIGWQVAFVASFSGHYLLTFRDQSAPLGRSALRFFGVSALGFSINESAYAVTLALGWRYDWALLLVLMAVAVMTYFLSRRWAFLRS